nr:cytochrome c biogenesis protein CcsA [Actinomycetales bacterium]
ADGLRPILDHYWLILHVSVAIMAVSVFSISAVLAVLQLSKDFSNGTGSVVERILSGLPSADTLERYSYRFAAVGFVMWTFTLVAGAIWAEHAWGRPWAWDAKEVWTLVIWLIYAGYLHARATRGWDGRRAAWLVITGFVAILLNYFVVNFLLSTKHGYAF